MSLVSGIEKIFDCEGYVPTFCRFVFVSEYRKTSWGIPSLLYFRKMSVTKMSMEKRRMSGVSVATSLSYSAEKLFRKILQGINNFGHRKKLRISGGGSHVFPSKI